MSMFCGGFGGFKVAYFETEHKLLLSWSSLWTRLSLDAALEAGRPRHLHRLKSRHPLRCVFFSAQFLSRFRVPCTVKYPYGCWIACSTCEKHKFSETHFYTLRIQQFFVFFSYHWISEMGISHLYLLRSESWNQTINSMNLLLETPNPVGCRFIHQLLLLFFNLLIGS